MLEQIENLTKVISVLCGQTPTHKLEISIRNLESARLKMIDHYMANGGTLKELTQFNRKLAVHWVRKTQNKSWIVARDMCDEAMNS